MISAAQCRAARALLDWTQDDLATNAQVARATVADFESNARLAPMRQNLIAIVTAFEASGVVFIPEEKNGQGAGLRFRNVKLEYSRTVKPDDNDVVVAARYRGKPLSVVVPRAILDALAARVLTELTNPLERVAFAQRRLSTLVRAAEQKCERGGDAAPGDRLVLSYGDFPAGTF
jgi:transcriptional regulator with XRE-family HTH domain